MGRNDTSPPEKLFGSFLCSAACFGVRNGFLLYQITSVFRFLLNIFYCGGIVFSPGGEEG